MGRASVNGLGPSGALDTPFPACILVPLHVGSCANAAERYNDRTDFGLIFPAASLNTGEAQLLARNSAEGPRTEVPSSAWSFLDERTVRINRTHPSLAKHDAGAAYEVIYTAKDPDISGVGYAITRDVVSFLRHDPSPANPLRGGIKFALAQGTS
jgi:hypothetical protein